jgi:hypothetical protein
VRFRLGLIAALAALALPAAAQAAPPTVGYGQPSYVDRELAGGEPLLWQDPLHHTLLYTSHEGTTHLYRPGLQSPSGGFQFISNYRNQVILWVSKDDGATWTRVNYLGTGFRTDPTENTGFSDPDFTQDAGGRIYDTGIDLANDALFSSPDGGITWDRGTIQCNDGDRPWLAGGVKDEVFMSTDTAEDGVDDPTGTGHAIFQSTDGGMTCQKVADDFGETDKNGAAAYVGYGKLFMDHARQRLIEPEIFQDEDGKTIGIGAGTWKRGDKDFTPHFISKTTLQGHFPSIALDSADNVYLTWDTNPRSTTAKDGCGGAASPLANQIMLAVSRDFGQTWSSPVAVAAPPSSRVLWPWAVAGDPGKVSVVWYQSDKVNDPDCAPDDVKWSIYASRLTGATRPDSMRVESGPASPVIHSGGICQGGTTCVATGQDRRLGDFFTNSIDARGCEVIASGDTRLTDETGGQLPTSRPIFIRQTSGPALTGSGSCGSGTAGRGDSSYVLGVKKKHKARCAATHRKRHKRSSHRTHRSAHKKKHKTHRRSSCAKKKHKKHHRRSRR